jgi:putative ABC transport system substrate-binding protein
MKRRDFITLLGSTAAWPIAARGQQRERLRRVGVLTVGDDAPGSTFSAQLSALREELVKLGWAEGRNLRLEVRFGANDEDRIRASAAEIVGLAPDVIVTSGAAPTAAVQQQTQTIPIVILGAGDVFANGFVKNVAHPEGNATGISNLFRSIGSKWVELLKEAVPQLKRVGFVYNAQVSGLGSYFPAIEEASRVLTVQATAISFSNAVDLVHGIETFAAEPDGGLITTPAVSLTFIKTINTLALQNRLPALYGNRASAMQGGLMSYGSRSDELTRRVASLVDHILRGAKVSDLPVEFPTKFDLVVNLKTAKAIGLKIPEAFLLRADELIE